MQAVTRQFALVGALVVLSVASGLAIVFLAQRLDPLMFIGLVVAALVGVYAFSSLPLAVLKCWAVLSQLRWLHLLWFLAFLSGLTLRIRGVEDIRENPLDLAAFYRVALMGIVGLALLGVFTLRRRPGIGNLFRGLVGLVAAYALVCLLLGAWSVYPSWTLYKSVEYLTTVALIAAVVGTVRTIRDFKTLFDWMWLLVGLVLVSVWIGVLVRPQEAILRGIGLVGNQIQGLFPRVAANGVGDLGAVIGIIALVRFLYAKGGSRRFYLAVLIMGLITLIFSQSRTPLIGILLAVPLVMFLDKRMTLLTAGALIISLMLSLTHLGDVFWQFFLRGQSQELFLSLSGRTYYWQSAMEFVKENPIFGHGAYAAGRFLVAKEFESTLSSLHGTWPEVLIGTGIAGLLPLLVAVVGTWMVLLRAPRRRLCAMDPLWQQLRLEAVGVMTLLSVRSIFSVSFIWHPALTWLLVLGYAEFLRRSHANGNHPQPLQRSGGEDAVFEAEDTVLEGIGHE